MELFIFVDICFNDSKFNFFTSVFSHSSVLLSIMNAVEIIAASEYVLVNDELTIAIVYSQLA